MTELDYKSVLQEARQYTTASKALYKRKKFDNKSLTNIACIAAEQFMVAYIMMQDMMPDHHALDYLIDNIAAMKDGVPLSLIDDVHYMEEFQNMCSLEPTEVKEPDNDDVERFINTLVQLDTVLFS